MPTTEVVRRYVAVGAIAQNMRHSGGRRSAEPSASCAAVVTVFGMQFVQVLAAGVLTFMKTHMIGCCCHCACNIKGTRAAVGWCDLRQSAQVLIEVAQSEAASRETCVHWGSARRHFAARCVCVGTAVVGCVPCSCVQA